MKKFARIFHPASFYVVKTGALLCSACARARALVFRSAAPPRTGTFLGRRAHTESSYYARTDAPPAGLRVTGE